MSVRANNRRDAIVEAASDLFINKGYTATSVRQIAEQAGVTEAAIYYHFKEGKRALLQAVVEFAMPDLISVLAGCQDASTLHDLLLCYGQGMADMPRHRVETIRWMIAEFPKLNAEERAGFQQKSLEMHAYLTTLLLPFIMAEQEASDLAWTLICTAFGYGNLFRHLGVEDAADFDEASLIAVMLRLITAHYG